MLDQNIELNLEEIPDLLLDDKEIRQLILNLVRNGLEAMDRGGTLRIKTFKDSSDVVLSVQDQGKGIEPTQIDKIFLPFYTTKENGTGLGLPSCLSIVNRHNAKLNIESNAQGTTISVRFQVPQKTHHVPTQDVLKILPW